MKTGRTASRRPEPESHDLAFGGAPADQVAAAVRGIVLRDMAILGLRAHVQWQTPRVPIEECFTAPRPFDAGALGMAQSLSSLGLALKRLCAPEVVKAPGATLVPAIAAEVESLLDRAASDELRRSVRRGSPAKAAGSVAAESLRWAADVDEMHRRAAEVHDRLQRLVAGQRKNPPEIEDRMTGAPPNAEENEAFPPPFAPARPS